MKNDLLGLLFFLVCNLMLQAQQYTVLGTHSIKDFSFDSVMNEFYIQEQQYDYINEEICSFFVKCIPYCDNKDTCPYILLMSGDGKKRTEEIIHTYLTENNNDVVLVKFKNVIIFVEGCTRCLNDFFTNETDTIVFSNHHLLKLRKKRKKWHEGEDDSYWPNTWICCLKEEIIVVIEKREGTNEKK